MRAWHAALALLLSCALQLASGATVLLQMLPGGISHQMQGLAVARRLHQRGHTVFALFADYDVGMLEPRGLLEGGFVTPIVFPTPPGSEEQVHSLIEDYQNKPREFIVLTLRHYESICRLVLGNPEVVAQLRGLNASLTIIDAGWNCGYAVSVLLGIPQVQLAPIDIATPFWEPLVGIAYSPAAHPFLASGMAPPLSFKERVVNTLVSPLVKALVVPEGRAIAERLARDFRLPSVPSNDRQHQTARLVLVNAAVGVVTPRTLPPNVKMVGPILVGGSPPRPLPPSLDAILQQAGPEGVVYATLGSAFRPSSCDLARGLGAALAQVAANRTVVWSIDALHFPAACPLASLGLPPSVHTLPWVPQSDLLAHPAVKVYLSHAGQNSMHEAAYRGVPVVCLPQGADQFDLCAKADKAGWGLRFDSKTLTPATAPTLAAAIDRVATDGSFARKAASVGALLRAHPRPAVDRAADLVEMALAMPEGAHLGDPTLGMPWWQWHCLDVYAAVAAPLLALLAAAAAAARWCWGSAGRRLRGLGRKKVD